jgi:hypothetical protein
VKRALMTIRNNPESKSTLQTALIVALVVGLPFATLAPQAAPLIGAIGVFVVLAVSFRELARIDRAAFLSIAIPAGTVALLGLAMLWRVALGLDEGVAVFFALLAFARGSFVSWWWRVVLRRPTIAFAIKLSSELREVTRLSTSVLTRADTSDLALASLMREIIRLRSLRAPDADWGQLRDAYADQWDAIVRLAQRSPRAVDYQYEAVSTKALGARFDELVARGC